MLLNLKDQSLALVVKQTNCLHTESYQCECCKQTPVTPAVSFLNQPANAGTIKKDIFHLTSANADAIASEDSQMTLNKIINPPQNTTLLEVQESDGAAVGGLVSDCVVAPITDEKRLGLREILISNFDPKFATRIGIKDFVPIQVMTSHMDGEKDLDFIPFEDIDHSYPK
jgi:hypothetical protein